MSCHPENPQTNPNIIMYITWITPQVRPITPYIVTCALILSPARYRYRITVTPSQQAHTLSLQSVAHGQRLIYLDLEMWSVRFFRLVCLRLGVLLLLVLVSSLFSLFGTAGVTFFLGGVPVGLLLGISTLTLFYLSIRLMFLSRIYLAISGVTNFAVVVFYGRNIPADQVVIWIWMASLPIICGTILSVPLFGSRRYGASAPDA